MNSYLFNRRTIVAILVALGVFAHGAAFAASGELDSALKKLLRDQQEKHKNDRTLEQMKASPDEINELFHGKSGIIKNSPALKKILTKKESKAKVSAKAKRSKSASKEVKSLEEDGIDDVVSANSAVVLDNFTGKLIYSREPFKKMAPASLTKIITAVVLLESNSDLSKTIELKHDIRIREDGVALGLKAGDQVKLEDLLYMAMLYSANDACVAIAEEVAGSVSDFAKAMNQKAKDIGAVNSNFVNPNGMPNSNHYSNAYDIAMISSYAMKIPMFAKVVGTKNRTVQISSLKEVTVKNKKEKTVTKKTVRVVRNIKLTNRHKLLGKVEGVCGIKTGYTNAAGRCLATCFATKEKNYIIVVLKGKDVAADTIALINLEKYQKIQNIAAKPVPAASAVQTGSIINETNGASLRNISLSTIGAAGK